MVIISLVFLAALLKVCICEPELSQQENKRDGKFFNTFQVVRFQVQYTTDKIRSNEMLLFVYLLPEYLMHWIQEEWNMLHIV